MNSAFGKRTAVEFIVREIMVLGQQHGKHGSRKKDEDDCIVTDEQLGKLEAIGLERIRKLAKDERLLLASKPLGLLYMWKELAGDSEPIEWVESTIASDASLLTFLEKSLGYSRSQGLGDYAVRVLPSLNPNSLEPFLMAEAAIGRIRALRERGEMTETQRAAVAQYIAEYEASGKLLTE